MARWRLLHRAILLVVLTRTTVGGVEKRASTLLPAENGQFPSVGPSSLSCDDGERWRLLLFASGSRGDLQPTLALAHALQSSCMRVHVVTNVNHVPFVRSFGLEVTGAHFDMEAFLRADGWQKVVETGDTGVFLDLYSKKVGEELPGYLDAVLPKLRSFRPDALLTTFLDAPLCRLIGKAFGLPVISTFLQPRAFSGDAPLLHHWPSLELPKRMKLALMTLFHLSLYKMETRDLHAALLERLPQLSTYVSCYAAWMLEFLQPLAPVLIGVSPKVAPRYSDQGEVSRIIHTGYWTVGERERRVAALNVSDDFEDDAHFGGADMASLRAFLDAGSRPAFIGWGSMISGSAAAMARLAVRALMLAGFRGVVLGGWAGLKAEDLPGYEDEELRNYASKHVIFVRTAPLEWLFSRCAVVVHHGGAGTLANSLRAGTPTIITPFAHDQFMHAAFVQHAGVGMGLEHYPKLNAADIAESIRAVSADSAMSRRAGELGEELRREDGIAVAVTEIQRFLRTELATGQWAKAFARRAEAVAALSAKPPGSLAWLRRLAFAEEPASVEWLLELS